MLLSRIAETLGLTLTGEDREITGLNTLEAAGPDELSFLANPKYIPYLAGTRAGAVILRPEHAGSADSAASSGAAPAPGWSALISENPYADFGRAMMLFLPKESSFDGVSPQAFVHPEAEIAATASIFPFAYIAAGARIGEGCRIFPGCYVGEDCVIGQNTTLFPNVTLMARTELGEGCTLHAGVVIGADGFGFTRVGGGILKIPQVGKVIIGNGVEIGANTTIDRAALSVTKIGDNTKIDNLVQIGHNVEVGEQTMIVAMSGIAGSTQIGDEVTIAGHAGIAGHLRIGNRATVGPYSGVGKDIPENGRVGGIPAMDGSVYMRWLATQPKLPDMHKRLNALEKELETLKAALKPGS